ncbi:MAG: D-serine ammonia-lyase [Veillonellaceae bacterium]|nr:D-serine ammonia-lyase [Veillonellaceae bacterium]
MENSNILGRTLPEWIRDYPLLAELVALREVWWENPACVDTTASLPLSLGLANVEDAERRLQRFAPYIAKAFPETQGTAGIIESPLVAVSRMQAALEARSGRKIAGSLYAKYDSHLPIAGSIKARGGVYEVLKVAEQLAIKQGMLTENDDYAIIDSEPFRQLYSRYSIAVGSTGNLGLSIGIMSAKLGFRVTVHMSADAKAWKKELLRSKGVRVVEYAADFSQAVAAGRQQSQQEPNSHFIDDENSSDLFLGYAVAALRLQRQLAEQQIAVDASHPLYVYLPCGVGGSPGGITFGLKLLFGKHVHCYFAEPTHAPAMLLGLMTGLHDAVSVQDFGIDNITAADGLAVGRPSGFVGKNVGQLISGVYTVEDDEMYRLLSLLADTENVFLEPSALAGFAGPARLPQAPAGATQIAWTTGGSMVPSSIMDEFYAKGRALREKSDK